ncbi:xylosyltransferase oxt [Parachaetomium inaequale]|uniref:Xylosyltransferase oxt n=1 Tax=Parachaetomium inaequale TaxID=2588326 RepID=A0AAN6PIT9_9PEZI|nr:xylosyltransferase oxt [Parachaetomium inaequale]
MLDDGANLPIPNRERNNGGSLIVYHGHHGFNGAHPHQPWRKPSSETDDDPAKLESCRLVSPTPPPPERKFFNLTLPTFILSCVLLVVTAALIILGGILGSKITTLENTIPSLTSITNPLGSPTSANETASNNNTNTTNNNTSQSSSSSSSSSNNPGSTTTPTPPTILISGWTYRGCYYDSEVRVLPDAFLSAMNMTNGVCAEFCSSDGRRSQHFGTQVALQCYCGSASAAVLASRRAPDWACEQQCRGRGSMREYCGGDWTLSLWERDGS